MALVLFSERLLNYFRLKALLGIHLLELPVLMRQFLHARYQ